MSKYANEKLPKEGLSILYRMGWQIRRVVFTVFGPAELGAASDPVQRLTVERRRKSAEAVAKKEAAAAASDAG